MSALLDLFRYSISSVFWGILIAVLFMGLFTFLIKGWYKDAQFTLPGIIVGALLFLLLSVQCILIMGSLKIIQLTDFYEVQIERLVESRYPPSEYVSLRQADDVIKEIIYEYPLLQYYIGGGEFTGFQAHELPHAIATELRSFMRWYIFRRLMWCLAFAVVGAIIVIKTMTKSKITRSVRQRPTYRRQHIDMRRRRR